MYPPTPFRLSTKITPNPDTIQVVGTLGLPPTEYHNHFYGYTSGKTVVYNDINAYTWFRVAPLDVPVRVDLAEQVGATIVDSDISFSYLYVSPVDVGVQHNLSPETKPDQPFRTFWVTGRQDSEAIINYRGETILGRMGRTPAPEVIEAGPFTPQQIMETLFSRWKNAGHDWLVWKPIPNIAIQTTDGVFVPTLDAIDVRQPKTPTEEPKSMLSVVEDFLRPFPGYFLHVDPNGMLEVVNTLGIPIGSGTADFYYSPTATFASTDKSSVNVELVISIYGSAFNVDPLFYTWPKLFSYDTQNVDLSVGDSVNLTLSKDWFLFLDGMVTITTDITLNYDGSNVTATLNSITSTGSHYYFYAEAAYTVRDTTLLIIDANNDLTPDEQENTLTDEVYNVCRVRSKGKSFNNQTDVMEPAAGIMNTKYGCWGNTICVQADHATVFGSSGRYDLGTSPCVEGDTGIAPIYAELPNLWKVQPSYILGSNLINVTAQFLIWWDQCGDFAGPGYQGTVSGSGSAYTDVGGWQLAASASWPTNTTIQVFVKPSYDSAGTFEGFRVRLGIDGTWQGAYGIGVRLNGDGVAFTENTTTITAEFGESSEDPTIQSSIAIYGRRVLDIDMGPYPIDYDTALKIAQAVVEKHSQPKREYVVKVMPPYTAIGPYQIGQRVSYEGKVCYVAAWRYTEAHTSNRSASSLTVTLHEIEKLNKADLSLTAYGEATYKLSPYGP